MPPTITENWTFNGRVTAKFFSCGDEQLESDNWSSAAAAALAADKQEHQYRITHAQESGTTAVAETIVRHVVRGATGSIIDFEAGCVVPCVGSDTISVDLTKNGTSVLVSTISLTSSQSARELVAGVLDPSYTDLVDGDVLEVAITVSAATGTMGKGPFASFTIREDANT
jgi:hypothetical protein